MVTCGNTRSTSVKTMLLLDSIRAVKWNGTRILSIFVILLGVFGITRYWFFPFSSQLITNPVYTNNQRISQTSAFEHLTSHFPINHAIVIGFTILIVLLALHYFTIILKLYPIAPAPVILATLFLGGAILFGLLVGISLMRVNEFIFQSASASEQEIQWLRSGIGFLIQIHLIYVFGWILCTGLGLTCLGSAAYRLSPSATRSLAFSLLPSGLLIVASITARLWLPYYGETAPTYAVFLSRLEIPLSIGLIASGSFSWLLGAHQHQRHNM